MPAAEPVPATSLERELLSVADEAARAAAAELMTRFGHAQAGVRSKSSPTDLVSDADVSAERAIRAVLAARRPDDAILGEEGGATGDGELRWVIDPLDGTTNFLFGFPQFAVSVACEDREGGLVGIVLDPVREECFAATRSGAPRLNGVVIESSQRRELGSALVATGFSYDADERSRQAEALRRVLPRVRDIRRAGAAALDLAWAACGRVDAFYERSLKAWDIAAGALVARRAGMVVRPLDARDGEPWGLIAAPPALCDELLALVLGD
jgi:myo-inositol-1(or 4)-monophosphatase